MKDVRIIPYMKKLEHTYSLGVFPTIELLEKRPEIVVKVIFHSRGKENSGVSKLLDLCRKRSIKTEWNDGTIKKLGGTENTYAIGILMKYKQEIETGKNHLVLVSPQDTGNLGTMIRTALGFGIRNIAIISPGVDVFDPKTIRAAMGAVFSVKIEYFPYIEDYSKKHKNNLYLLMTDGSKEISQISFASPYSLVMGSESAGLPKEFAKLGTTVTIKQSADIDSLNLSVAAGIAMYTAFK